MNNLSQLAQALGNAGSRFDSRVHVDVIKILSRKEMWPVVAEMVLSLIGLYAIYLFYQIEKGALFWAPLFFFTNGALHTYSYIKTWGAPEANLYYLLAYGRVYDSGIVGFAIIGRFFAGYFFSTNSRIQRSFSGWDPPGRWRR